MPKSAIHGYADVFLPFTFDGRAVNTPEMAIPIFLERLKNET